jgi:hypothetical protein
MQHNLEETNEEFEGTVNLKKLAGGVCANVLLCGLVAVLVTGCSAMTSLLLTPDPAGSAPEAPRNMTTVKLSQANYHVEKLNLTGQDHGFKLLGLFTIVPASRVKAFTRMYQAANIPAGGALAPANILVEQYESFYILFSIPEVHVRADFVVFDDTRPHKPENLTDTPKRPVWNGPGSGSDSGEPAPR